VIKKTLPKDTATQKTTSAKPTNKTDFNIDDFIIYPSHGVGQIKSIETLEIAGGQHHLYIIYFDKEKLTIKIPINKALSLGLRHPVPKKQIEDVLSTLRTGIKKTKGMWSRRAQEYETKINSGDIFLLAEVVRDLTRDIEDSERSFSERVIYETAVFRLAYEYSIVYGCNIEEAKEKIITISKDKVVSIQNKVDKYDFDFDDIDRTKNDEDEEDEEDDEDDEEDHYKALDKYITEEDDEDLLEQFKKAERTVGVKKNKPPKKSKKND
jgi:CarD family transcriptional regulator